MNITASGTNRPESAVASARPKASARLLFIDNIRVFLTILVLLFHMMIIYAGTGSWLYSEGRQDEITSLLGAWFVAQWLHGDPLRVRPLMLLGVIAGAVAASIHGVDREVLRQKRQRRVPLHMIDEVAVNHQQRQAVPHFFICNRSAIC